MMEWRDLFLFLFTTIGILIFAIVLDLIGIRETSDGDAYVASAFAAFSVLLRAIREVAP